MHSLGRLKNTKIKRWDFMDSLAGRLKNTKIIRWDFMDSLAGRLKNIKIAWILHLAKQKSLNISILQWGWGRNKKNRFFIQLAFDYTQDMSAFYTYCILGPTPMTSQYINLTIFFANSLLIKILYMFASFAFYLQTGKRVFSGTWYLDHFYSILYTLPMYFLDFAFREFRAPFFINKFSFKLLLFKLLFSFYSQQKKFANFFYSLTIFKNSEQVWRAY